MSEPIVASTQYGDFKGTVSIDETDGQHLLLLLAARVKIPRGYWPVGFGIGASTSGGRKDHSWHLTVYAVDAHLAVSGKELTDYIKQNDHVPVFEFHQPLEPSDFVDLMAKTMKRLDIVAVTRALNGKPMMLLDDN